MVLGNIDLEIDDDSINYININYIEKIMKI